MKMNQKVVLFFAVASCVALPVAARQANSNDEKVSPPPSVQPGAVAYNDLAKADKIIGMTVTDPQERKLGSVKDLALYPPDGRIAEVVIGTGGFIGMDEKMIAVPPQSLTFANSGKELRLNDAATFRIAPFFKMSHWKEAASAANIADVYQRFHVPSYAYSGAPERAGKIMGLTVKNQQLEHLGKVDTLVVDLSTGRVAEYILASGGFLGIKDELSAVPPQAFRWNSDHDMLTLDTTRDALRNAPHFKPDDWRSSVNNSASLSGVYNAYNVPPYFTPGSVNDTVQNAVPPLPTVPNGTVALPEDLAITAQIQQLIQVAASLSADARNVRVTTQSGRVTLSGTADSQKEKSQLGDLAASVVPANHVTNNIEVKDIGATTSVNGN
jgi:sporulation protein YlmC with PRC-barrel domain